LHSSQGEVEDGESEKKTIKKGSVLREVRVRGNNFFQCCDDKNYPGI